MYVKREDRLREVVLCVVEGRDGFAMGAVVREELPNVFSSEGWRFREWDYRWDESREEGAMRRGMEEALFGGVRFLGAVSLVGELPKTS